MFELFMKKDRSTALSVAGCTLLLSGSIWAAAIASSNAPGQITTLDAERYFGIWQLPLALLLMLVGGTLAVAGPRIACNSQHSRKGAHS
jgi:hypothetical protein